MKRRDLQRLKERAGNQVFDEPAGQLLAAKKIAGICLGNLYAAFFGHRGDGRGGEGVDRLRDTKTLDPCIATTCSNQVFALRDEVDFPFI